MLDNTNIPEISVVVPVFNSAKTIERLIFEIEKSVLLLNLNIEIILVNDCSTDVSREVIEDLVSRKGNIKGLNNSTNLGQIKSTNLGISSARGNYIVTIDDDLEYPPSEIEKLYKKIVSENLDVVFGIAKDKYSRQGKSKRIAHFRNWVLNSTWNKPVTDSFKIFKKSILYRNQDFLLKNNFEAFITQNKDLVSIGYESVGFNKRLVGKSNYTLLKKIRFIWEMNKGFK